MAAEDVPLRAVWEWCKERGLLVNRLWPGYSAAGRGLHATSAVEAAASRADGRGELLLRVPASLLFNTRSIRSDPLLGPLLREAACAGVPRLSPLATLCLGLIHERAMGAASRWAPMIASFPSEMITAEQFTVAELAQLPWAAALHDEARMQQENLAAASRLINGLLDAGYMPGSHRAAFGPEGLSWAWSVISTRACFL